MYTYMDTWYVEEMELQIKADFSMKGARTTHYSYVKKNKTRPLLHIMHKTQFLRIKVIRKETQ